MSKDFADLDVYKMAMEVGRFASRSARAWSYFDRSVIGIQFARAAHGIAANLAEASGRWHFKDRAQFMYYARGSARETRCWLDKARLEGLVSEADWLETRQTIVRIEKMLSSLAERQRRRRSAAT